MALAAKDIEFIKSQFGEWLAEQTISKPPVVYEIELRERIVRVEEELKHQREILKTILVEMHARFEASDKRFDDIQTQMDKRFEAVQQQMDKRFESQQQYMDKRFETLTSRIDRFMLWSFATSLAIAGAVIAVLK